MNSNDDARIIGKLVAALIMALIAVIAMSTAAFAEEVPAADAVAKYQSGKITKYYSSFPEACAQAPDSATVTLLRDDTTERSVALSKNLTIDLNSYTWTCTGTGDNDYHAAFRMTGSYVTVNFKDMSIVGTGRVVARNCQRVLYNNVTQVNIYGGRYEGKIALTYNAGFSYIYGGELIGSTRACEQMQNGLIRVVDGYFSDDAINDVSGTTFEDKNKRLYRVEYGSQEGLYAPDYAVMNEETAAGYAGLAAAVTAANSNDTITVRHDITSSETITVDKAVTLDTNDRTISRANSLAAYLIKVVSGGDLTIKGGGKITSGAYRALSIENGGAATLVSATLQSSASTVIIGANSSFEMSAGTVECTGSGNDSTAVHATSDAASVTISGGNVKGQTYALNGSARGSDGSHMDITGGAFYGLIRSTTASAGFIRGGWFDRDINTAVNPENHALIADGYLQFADGWVGLASDATAAIKEGDSSLKCFHSLKEACQAAESGDTIEMIGDEEAGETINISGKTISIELDGHAYNYLNDTSDDAYAFTLGEDADITFSDKSDGEKGLLYSSCNLIRVNSLSATLTIESGTYKSKKEKLYKDFATVYNKGKTFVTGGKIINEGNGVAIHNVGTNRMIDPEYGELTITGGSVIAAKSDAIKNNGIATINGEDNGVVIKTEVRASEGGDGCFALLCNKGNGTVIDGNTSLEAPNGANALGVYSADVTLKNGHVNGTLKTGDYAEPTIEGGIIEGECEFLSHTRAKIKGGIFNSALRVNGQYNNDFPKVTIENGVFKGDLTATTYAQVNIENGKFSGESLWSSYYATIRASGGYFVNDPIKDHIQQGCKFVDNLDEPERSEGYRYAVKPDSYCVVKYDTKGGTDISPVGAESGDLIPLPDTDPEKNGWTFDGWYYDSGCTKAVKETDTVAGDATIYAGWKRTLRIGVSDTTGGKIKLTVGTEDKGEITEFEDAVHEGTAVRAEAKPDAGFSFEKWADSDTGQTITNDAVCEFAFGDTAGYLAYFKPVLVETIRFKQFKNTVAEGDKLQVEVVVSPSDAQNKDVLWRSSDESVLTIDETGLMTGVSEGSTFITVKAADVSGVSVSRRVTVTHKHAMTHQEAKAATCEEEGNTEYWYCEKCKKYFADAEGNTEIEENGWILKPVGHDWGDWVVTKEATKDETGLQVRTCKNDSSHTEELVIPKKDHEHELIHTEEKPATCEARGTREHYECSICNAYYEDAEATKQISGSDILIPAKGHTAGAPVKGEEMPATCTSVGGYNLTTKCSVCGKVLKMERIVTPVDPNAHDWDEWEPSEDGKGFFVRYCKNDSSHMQTRIDKAKVVLSGTVFTYNGKVIKPVVKTVGGMSLIPGTDYSTAWSAASPRNVGTYTVTVTGKGNYSGVAKATYTINPKGTSIKKPKKAKRAITVRWRRQSAKMAASRITGYQIQIATNKTFTKNRKTISVKGYKKVSKKIKKLKRGKKYYVRVRTFKTVSGKKYYSRWSKIKAVKTRR